MRTETLDGQMGREVTVDVCASCQSIWFDSKESLQLTPGATLKLFRVIGENVARPVHEAGDVVRCPRCNARLRRTQDMQRNTRFQYFKCPNEHGRLIAFFDFLKEKDFIKPLTAQQIAELRKSVEAVNCSNCGAPVNLAQGSDCTHCGSPLSMLDLGQAEKVVTQLRDAEAGKTVDPALPLALARARRETEAAFQGVPREMWGEELSSLGIVNSGLTTLIRFIKGQR
jgi:DNA-directed RNA polymerase subunit RPC12/RpoP